MKLTHISLSVLTLAVALSPALQADEWNKKTIITISEAMQIPGKVLPAGKYVLKLVESQSNRHIVQIMNEREDHVEATLIAIPNYRLQPTGNSSFGFWETPAGTPKALRSWFYPGDNFGQEFAYPKDFAATLNASNREKVPMLNEESSATTEVATAAVPAEAPAPEAAPAPAQVVAPETETTVAAAAPAPVSVTEAPERTTLPTTASPLAAIALGGLLMVSAGLSLSAYSARR
ncbi:hypothetical protein [Bryobacter aggregatus]|uniref:hypothetical protein n=1 Tax=Bryobacter aggregatus TaxID=360054 RepID=UPI0012BAD5E5|nr:hypothetical protein [Bryobacter aggregatus]